MISLYSNLYIFQRGDAEAQRFFLLTQEYMTYYQVMRSKKTLRLPVSALKNIQDSALLNYYK